MNRQANNLILLTGAGFTKNFGGFLAREMWSCIFNHTEIQKSDRLRELLLESEDFEGIYSDVLSGLYSDEEKDAMKQAVEGAYKLLDDTIRDWTFREGAPYPVNVYGVKNLLSLFAGHGNQKGFFFTLNQDLFIERTFHYRPPGAPPFCQQLYSLSGTELEKSQFVTLPDRAGIEAAERDLRGRAGLVYVKLHGSYGWQSASGSHQMVIGKNKTALIEKEPLLKWYMDLFKEAAGQGGKMLIIGYGFRDQHINEILLHGVENCGLKLYVMSTHKTGVEFDNHISFGSYYARGVLKGLRGLYPYTLGSMFPSDQSETVQWRTLRQALLD